MNTHKSRTAQTVVVFVAIFVLLIASGYTISSLFSVNIIDAINMLAIPFIGIFYIAGVYYRDANKSVVKPDV